MWLSRFYAFLPGAWRALPVGALAAAGCASPAPAADDAPAEIGPRSISIGVDALDTARAVAAAHGVTLDVIDADADVAVVVFDAASSGALSEQLHERFRRTCACCRSSFTGRSGPRRCRKSWLRDQATRAARRRVIS